MPDPQAYIPQTDPYSVPQNFQLTTTNGGGTAYLDSTTGAKYTRDTGGFKLFKDFEAAPTLPGVVSSSAPVVQSENNLKQTIAGFALPDAGTTDAQNASANYTKLIDDQIAQLEQRRKDEIASINSSFDITKGQTENAQTRETGAYNVALQRIGGYLGDSASGTGAMLTLAKNHRDELTALEAKRQAAINEANIAITDKQFDLARQKAAEVKDLSQTIYDRKNKFFDQAVKLQDEARAQSQLEITQSKEARDKESYIVDSTAPSLFKTINSITDAGQKETYIQKTAQQLGINADILKGGLIKYQNEQNQKVNASILELAQKYPDSGISNADLATGDINSVIKKVTESRSFKLANAETQASITAKLAAAAKDRLAVQGGGDLSALAAAAEQWATTGKPPVGMTPKDPRYGVVYQMAKQVELPAGTVVDGTTGIKSAKLTAQEQQAMDATFSLLNYDIPALRAAINSVSQFPGKGLLNAVGQKVGLESTEAKRFDDLANGILTKFAQKVSGVAVAEQEFARLSKLLPKQGNLKKYNEVDLQNFEDSLKSDIKSYLTLKGAAVVGMDLRTPEEKAADNAKAAQFDSPNK